MSESMVLRVRVSRREGFTFVEDNGVRCGMVRCPAILGDLVSIDGDKFVSLLEGFRQEEDGVYRLHDRAQERYRVGMPPRDAHGRWMGFTPTGEDSWSWGPKGSSIPGDPLADNSSPPGEARRKGRKGGARTFTPPGKGGACRDHGEVPELP